MANLIKIEKYLKQRKLPYKIVELDREAFTVSDVVRAGIDHDEVVKTLIVRFGLNNKFAALALRGKDRVDFKKVRKLFRSKAELAKPEEVLRVVGVPIGAVCPVQVGIPLYLDQKVMDLGNVHIGSGDLMHGLEMKFSDLLKVVGDYTVEDFV